MHPSTVGADTFEDYQAAKNKLAAGRKDTGLRLLWTLRHDLTHVPNEDEDNKRLQNLLDDTIYRWGEGFDWD